MSEGPSDADIESVMLALIAKRGLHSSACPSEVARALSKSNWRALMPRVRDLAWQLMQLGQLDISQGGVSIAGNARVVGPLRIRLARPPPDATPTQ